MKAVLWTNYGGPDVLRYTEVAKPAPKAGEVLIRVVATTVTAGDCETRALAFPLWMRIPLRLVFGVRKPRRPVLGQELAGVVEAAGERVTRFKAGDRLFGATQLRMGAHAEYACLPEKGALAPIPESVSFEQAATIPTGGVNALHFLRKTRVREGESVLIHGAGGSIGTYAVQIAKSLGALVTCVDSGEKLGMLRSIGADHTIDYTREEFDDGREFDVVIDVAGKAPFRRAVRSLRPGGRLFLGNPSMRSIIRGLWATLTGPRTVKFELASYKPEDLSALAAMVESGKLKPVIGCTYPLDRTPEAHRFVETGRKQGNLVITVADEGL